MAESTVSPTEITENETESNSDHFCLNQNSLESFRLCIRDQALRQLRHMHQTQADVFTFIYICISLLGILGNGLVIFVVIRRKEMRTTRNVFIVNLALSNFLTASILVPFLWLPTYRIEFPYGAFMCKVAQAFPSTNIFCSTLTVSAIAVDRYFAIVRVTRIGPATTKSVRATLIAVSTWILSFSFSILYLLHFNIKDYVLPSEYVPQHLSINPNQQHILLFQRCELQPQPCLDMEDDGDFDGAKLCYKYYETAVSGIMALFIYCVPMPILVIFSFLLTRFLANNERQHSRLRQRVTASTALLASCASTGSVIQKKTSPSVPLINRNGDGTGRVESNSRRSRTTALLFAMAFSNAVLWLPFTVISLFIHLSPSDITKNYDYELRQLDDAAKLISMFSICVNPFLYGYMNTNFKREFVSIFRKCLCPKGTSNRTSVLLSARRENGQRPVRMEDHENSVIVYANGEYAVRNWST